MALSRGDVAGAPSGRGVAITSRTRHAFPSITMISNIFMKDFGFMKG
jgi:hypothetical protein